MSKTVNLSIAERSDLINLIPRTGSLSEITKYRNWVDELNMTPEEEKVEQSINSNSKSKETVNKAFNEWIHEIHPIEISDELFDFIKSTYKSRDEQKTLTVDIDPELVKKFYED